MEMPWWSRDCPLLCLLRGRRGGGETLLGPAWRKQSFELILVKITFRKKLIFFMAGSSRTTRKKSISGQKI
jgi:hypothetical protein